MAIRGTVCAGVHSEPERAEHQRGIRRECAPKCLRLPWGKSHSLGIVNCLSMMGEVDWVPEAGKWAGLHIASPGTVQNDGF